MCKWNLQPTHKTTQKRTFFSRRFVCSIILKNSVNVCSLHCNHVGWSLLHWKIIPYRNRNIIWKIWPLCPFRTMKSALNTLHAQYSTFRIDFVYRMIWYDFKRERARAHIPTSYGANELLKSTQAILIARPTQQQRTKKRSNNILLCGVEIHNNAITLSRESELLSA